MGGGLFVPKLRNSDGSRNVYCRKCGRLIAALASGQAGFGSAICAICGDQELSPENYDALVNNVRIGSGFMVPRAAIQPEVKDMPDDPVLGKEARAGFINYWVRVIKAAVFRGIEGGKEEASKKRVPVSKQVAIERKRKRTFRIEDNDSAVIDLSQLPNNNDADN